MLYHIPRVVQDKSIIIICRCVHSIGMQLRCLYGSSTPLSWSNSCTYTSYIIAITIAYYFFNTHIPEVGSSKKMILGMLSSCTAMANLFRCRNNNKKNAWTSTAMFPLYILVMVPNGRHNIHRNHRNVVFHELCGFFPCTLFSLQPAGTICRMFAWLKCEEYAKKENW